MLEVGDALPDFDLGVTDGSRVTNKDWKGKKVVLYFYPKDNTPGCTIESLEFKSYYSKYQAKGVLVYGISLDDEKSHKKFTEKNELPFPLISDVDAKLATAFGVYGTKKFMGKEYMGITRSTFIIDDSKIVKVFPKVKPQGHAKEILDSL